MTDEARLEAALYEIARRGPARGNVAAVINEVMSFRGVLNVVIRGEHPDPFIEIVITPASDVDARKLVGQVQAWADEARPVGGPLWRVVLG